MKIKNILSLVTTLILLSLLGYFLQNNTRVLSNREKYSAFLKSHPFNNRPVMAIEKEGEEEGENEGDRPDLAWEQDFMKTLDPALGRPAPERLPSIISQMKNYTPIPLAPGSVGAPWIERGPNNVGGRTRTLVWDPNDVNQKKVWAGSVTGGLWYNDDITNSNSTWNSVNDFWANIGVTCMAFDPNNPQIAYLGTGEGWNASSSRGAGLWKTINGGLSWAQLASTTGFYFTNDITVRNEGGTSVVYAAVDGAYYGGIFSGASTAGLQRSANGGASWTQVLPNIPSTTINFVAADIETGANNRLWIGTKGSPYSSTDKGGGRILYSDNGTTWIISNVTPVTNGHGRVELACAPSNANYVYAIIENDNTANVLKKTINGGGAWTNITKPVDADTELPTTDFSRGQAWYDLILAVDPNNESIVIAGSINLFRTLNEGAAWSQITKWSNNNNLSTLSCALVHSDQHAIAFKPGSSSTVIFGNDGGVFYSSSISTAASSSVITSRNKSYNVTQFYACAMFPTSGSNIYIAGAQDNGTQRYTASGMNTTNAVSSGDGAFCFIDQTDPFYQISSYVYNTYHLSTNGGISNFSINLVADQTTGRFINPADYDDNMDILYSARTTSTLQRIKNITGTPTSAQVVSISGMNDFASHIRVSPYTTSSTTLFAGTEAGALFKVTNADLSPSVTNITGSSFPSGSISCVETGVNENELLVTFSNYGVNSIWYTANGGSSWISKEGSLPDMPVRWALFNPLNRNEVLLATELGVWACTNFNAASPTWVPSNSGLSNVRVDMLQIRDSDKQVIAATYGRGLYSCNGFAASPTAAFTADKRVICLNENVNFTDTSYGGPTSWAWTITPGTYTLIGGTTLTSKNPKVQFNANGSYTISLSASNSLGTSPITKTGYIVVGANPLPFTENWENSATYANWLIENPDSGITWSVFNVTGNGTSTKSAGVENYNYPDAGISPQRDGLISPSLNLNGYSSVTLSFKYAYSRFDSTSMDSMAIYISVNCGSTWTRLISFRESRSASPFIYITAPDNQTNFSPSSITDWCGNTGYGVCKSISLNAYTGNNIKIKFENISGFGNNLFIDDISVTGISNTPAPVADFTSSTSTCVGVPATLTDQSTNAPTSWDWSFTPNTVTFVNGSSVSSKNPQVIFNVASTYTIALNVSNAGGSSLKTKANYTTSVASVIPGVSVSTNDSVICQGQSVIFTSLISNGGTLPIYQWKVNNNTVGTNISTFTSTTINNTDLVKCILISNAVCATPLRDTAVGIVMKVNSLPTPPIITTSGNTLTCSASGFSYKWSVNGTMISGANNQILIISQSGAYKVMITTSSGCTATSAEISVVKTGINELYSINDMKIFPNPATGIFNFEYNVIHPSTVHFSVYDQNGKIIIKQSEDLKQGLHSKMLNLNDQAKGIYQVKIEDGFSVITRTIIIE